MSQPSVLKSSLIDMVVAVGLVEQNGLIKAREQVRKSLWSGHFIANH